MSKILTRDPPIPYNRTKSTIVLLENWPYFCITTPDPQYQMLYLVSKNDCCGLLILLLCIWNHLRRWYQSINLVFLVLPQQNYINVVVVCNLSFHSKSPTAADESSWAALKHSRFQNYFTLEFFSTFQKVQLQQIRAADTFRFFNFGWDDLVDGSKEGRMDGRMVPRQIMVFVFRLCLLRISMIGAVVACVKFHLPFQQLLHNTCLGAILWMHSGKLSMSLEFG